MTMFALVSTVDTLGEKFPSNCVMLFRTEGEAYDFAAELLVAHGKHVTETEVGWQYSSGSSVDDAMEYLTAASLVIDWQDSLSSTEYFHVFPVADLPQTVRELFLDRDHESFVRSIERMNQMYRLQVSTIPTLTFIDNKADGSQHAVSAAKRLQGFKKTLLDEIDELDPIIELASKLEVAQADPTGSPIVIKEFNGATMFADDREIAIACLTSVADVLADAVVFCVSEMRKFGLPPAAIMAIVMESNKSKLQPDGSAKYDDNGKFLKGPNYFPPEPKLKELISELLEGHDPFGDNDLLGEDQ